MFSKKWRKGSQPPKTFKAGGKIIRNIVIRLKDAKYVEKFGKDDESNFGLFFPKTGRPELDKIASGLLKKNKKWKLKNEKNRFKSINL